MSFSSASVASGSAPAVDQGALRRRRFDFQPWEFRPLATAAERAEQAAYQGLLAAGMGVHAGPECYLSPAAAILGSAEGGALRLGARGYVAANAYVTGRVELGEDCTVNPYAVLRENVRGGDGVRIGAFAALLGFNHGYTRTDVPVFQQGVTSRGIVLGDDVWVGSHVTVLDGVTVGSHAILAAGAVVTKDVPDFAIVGGNPARVLRMRERPGQAATTTGVIVTGEGRAEATLREALTAFGRRVGAQWPAVLARCSAAKTAAPGFVDTPGARRRVRPWCDAVEIAAAFGQTIPGFAPAALVTILRGFQDPASGLVPEHLPEDRAHDPGPPADPALAGRYWTMAVHYALGCLGATLAYPVRNAADLDAARLASTLDALPWAEDAWAAGHWVDCFATCLLVNGRDFRQPTLLDALFAELDARCDPATGMWGAWRQADRWRLPVNGFYRLTRGTYAQWGRPLPHPERAVDTVLAHAADPACFGDGRGSACDVLDVAHPLWLCGKQTVHRRAEAEAWARARLPGVLACWRDGEGFPFDLSAPPDATPAGSAGLQGTEMWLAIVWHLADLLGAADALGYRPRGVHRPAPAALTSVASFGRNDR